MGDQSAGGIGFVDALTCALAAVLLLFMAQAAQPPTKKGFGAAGTVFTVRLGGKTEGPPPNLAIRFRLKGEVARPREARAKNPYLQVDAAEDGLPSYTVYLSAQAAFEPDDVFLVYLHDLNRGDPAGKSPVEANLIGHRTDQPGTRSPKPVPGDDRTLSVERPVLQVPLQDMADNKLDLQWGRPSEAVVQPVRGVGPDHKLALRWGRP